MSDVAAAVEAVRARIERAGGDPDGITIVGAKPPDVAACRAAIAAGIVDLGENRAQELAAKAPEVDGARWHFIGRLQTNKVRSIVEHVALWESLDRVEALDAVASRAPGAEVLVQVNISGEVQKGGCEPSSTAGLVHHATAVGLRVVGLMGIGPLGDPEAARPGFRTLRGLADELGLDVRSMGMTSDLEVAVQEGATMVRIGTALFGPRR